MKKINVVCFWICLPFVRPQPGSLDASGWRRGGGGTVGVLRPDNKHILSVRSNRAINKSINHLNQSIDLNDQFICKTIKLLCFFYLIEMVTYFLYHLSIYVIVLII